MLIYVTEKHIENGQRGCTKSCPVALALKEAFPDAKIVYVAGEIRLSFENYIVREWTSPMVRDFIATFDLGYPVGPMGFDFP